MTATGAAVVVAELENLPVVDSSHLGLQTLEISLLSAKMCGEKRLAAVGGSD